MFYKKYSVLTVLFSASLFSSLSYAAPASYADLIADERQKMLANNPIVGQESQKKPVIRPLTWGTIIQDEHQRMLEKQPYANGEFQKVREDKSYLTNPTSYGDIIKAQKAKMKQQQ